MAGGLTFGERMRLAIIEADRQRRAALASMKRAPLIGWGQRSARADQMLILPPDVRIADPSFVRELEDGQLGLAEAVADISRASAFEVTPPSAAWLRELHGFAWLRHLRAAQSDETRLIARGMVREWIGRYAAHRGVPWETSVVARRVLSWMTHAGFLLDDTSADDYTFLTDSLGRQIVHLAASLHDSPPGYPRLLAIAALVTADLCIAGHDERLERDVRTLRAELKRQVLADGGHETRNPGVLVEIMLDLVPLRQCFLARQQPVPDELAEAISGARGMLGHLRLGDGTIARFNGMGATSPEALATIFSHEAHAGLEAVDRNGPSGYVR
ncbi:MAG TPA: heparinase, partial [Hyphomicrobiaceae bacterium]|nr:heparinase [Hyphomicrobiaceae bacterium]